MEKQQKIVEMAKDICRVQHNCNDVCKPISACDALRYAERAIEAGYVKQSKGTWELKRPNGSYYCSCCGKGIKIKFGERAAIEWDFCPNCGAKMKGGE